MIIIRQHGGAEEIGKETRNEANGLGYELKCVGPLEPQPYLRRVPHPASQLATTTGSIARPGWATVPRLQWPSTA